MFLMSLHMLLLSRYGPFASGCMCFYAESAFVLHVQSITAKLHRATSHEDIVVSVVSDPTQPVSPLVLLARLSLCFIGA